MNTELFEDTVRLTACKTEECFSPYCDRLIYHSSVTPGLELAVLVRKPEKPGYLIATTHGWHMSIPEFDPSVPPEKDLWVHVDMRGRAFSTGSPDCNGLELMDVYDAVELVRRRYAAYLIDPDTVYFEGGSGGGGNAYALAVKFPDYFAAVTAQCGISDYAEWYRRDGDGEFRDEMDVWIGKSPDEAPMAYAAASGACAAGNLSSSLYIAHGETDVRVPVWHARNFVRAAEEAGKGDLVRYRELPGVGTRAHFGNATPGQMELIERESEENRQAHRSPVELPRKGTLMVPGYLVTRHFYVMLDDIGCMGTVDYDIDGGLLRVSAPCGWHGGIR